MAVNRQRGITLVELLIASSLSLVVGLVVASLFRATRKMSVETTSSYLISRDLEEGLRMLRNDLINTALASVRLWPPPGQELAPAVTMVSGANATGGDIHLGANARPRWQSWVCYGLEADQGSNHANLVRWAVERPDRSPGFPTLAPIPSPIPQGGNRRVVFRNMAAPNLNFNAGGETISTASEGGFRVRFLRRNSDGSWSGSPYNPAEVTTKKVPGVSADQNTGLIEMRLAFLQNDAGKPTYLELPVRVRPRY